MKTWLKCGIWLPGTGVAAGGLDSNGRCVTLLGMLVGSAVALSPPLADGRARTRKLRNTSAMPTINATAIKKPFFITTLSTRWTNDTSSDAQRAHVFRHPAERYPHQYW